MRDARGFARLQLALDVALVSAIVATSGGARSIFVPLYVLTVLAASFVLSRAGAFAVAGLSSVFYVAVVLGPDALASLGGVSGSGTTTDEALAILPERRRLPRRRLRDVVPGRAGTASPRRTWTRTESTSRTSRRSAT